MKDNKRVIQAAHWPSAREKGREINQIQRQAVGIANNDARRQRRGSNSSLNSQKEPDRQ
jgi:hypothetical protein